MLLCLFYFLTGPTKTLTKFQKLEKMLLYGLTFARADGDASQPQAAPEPLEAVMSFVAASAEDQHTVMEHDGQRGSGRPAAKRFVAYADNHFNGATVALSP